MNINKNKTVSRNVFGLLVFGMLTAFSSSGAIAQSGEGIPIMILGEDSDPKSIPRSSDIVRRVMLELSKQMSRHNYYVVDEVAISAEFDWPVRDRRPKKELYQVLNLANASSNASFKTNAAVIFKIVGQVKDLGFAKQAYVRISGELYDPNAKRFINGFEVPRLGPFPIELTIEETVGDRAREIASELGNVLKKQLAKVVRGSSTSAPSSGKSSVSGFATTYSFVFRNFSTKEVYAITEVMEGEFPGFFSSGDPEGSSSVFKYPYKTKAKSGKLLKWVNLLLMDQGLDPDDQVNITKRGTKFEIEKLFDEQPAAEKPTGKYN